MFNFRRSSKITRPPSTLVRGDSGGSMLSRGDSGGNYNSFPTASHHSLHHSLHHSHHLRDGGLGGGLSEAVAVPGWESTRTVNAERTMEVCSSSTMMVTQLHNTPCQYTIHPINTPYRYKFSIHPVNISSRHAPCQPTLTTNPINTTYQHVHSTHPYQYYLSIQPINLPVNTPCQLPIPLFTPLSHGSLITVHP